ncbi:hypothetical protein BH10PAT1_BH10PAT1_3630 [soil metagenome]
MKHQYFGDISDYKKYSILRSISNNGQLKTMVCWMLTANDERNDGNVNKYLNKPEEWRSFEPDIFDFLHEAVLVRKTKDLNLVEQKGIILKTNYFWEILTDNLYGRQKYFANLHEASKDCDVVFLDPDNGIATESIKKGRKNSSKYVFWDEVKNFWKEGFSLLVYQHFPRVNRMQYINKIYKQTQVNLGKCEVYAIKTNFMVYFLIVQKQHKFYFVNLKKDIEARWKDEIEIFYL